MDKQPTDNPCPVCGCKCEFVSKRSIAILSACADCGMVRDKFEDVELPFTTEKGKAEYLRVVQNNKALTIYAAQCSSVCAEALAALTGEKRPAGGVSELIKRLTGVVRTAGMAESILLRKLSKLEKLRSNVSDLYVSLCRIRKENLPEDTLTSMADVKSTLFEIESLEKVL